MTVPNTSTVTNAAAELSTSPAGSGKSRLRESVTGWLMASPAIILILSFLIVPFVMAFGLAFTNQRLISPNPTEWVGLQNFERLLRVNLLPLEPILNETTGAPVLDEEGSLTYPRVREFTRNNPDYPQYDGMQEWFAVNINDTKYTVLAGDAVFMKSLVNVFLFRTVCGTASVWFGLNPGDAG